MSILEALKSILKSKPTITPDNFSLKDLLLRSVIEEAAQHVKEGVVVSVTDLVYCSAKYFLQRQYPEIKLAADLHPTLILGRVLHRGIQEILLEKFHDFIQVEVPFEKSVSIDVNGLPEIVKVTGRVDAVLNNDTIIEIKTSRADHELPLPHHVMQVRIYLNITNKKKGMLFYINPDRISEYWIEEPINDFELQRLITETLQNKKHPRYEWECSYCPFNILCPYKRINNRRGR